MRVLRILGALVLIQIIIAGCGGNTIVPKGVLPVSRYTVRLLFSPVQDASSEALDINENGVVVGNAVFEGSTALSAALWNGSTATNIGSPGGWQAFALNDSGVVAGGTDKELDSGSEALLWQTGTMAALLSYYAVCTDVNNLRDAACIRRGRAILWRGGVANDLGSLGGGKSEAYSLSDLDVVAGRSTIAGGGDVWHAFLWKGGRMSDLGTLGGTESVAYHVNNHDQVVGMSKTHSGLDHAFVWELGKMRDLGAMGSSTRSSCAYGINDLGQVVGSLEAAAGRRACLWQERTFVDLNNQIPATPGLVLREARSISNRGQIVGNALYEQRACAFILTPVK